MDNYILQQELEALAGNAFNPNAQGQDGKPEPMRDTIARWTKLFNLSQGEAVDGIVEHRSNLTRPRISDAHWDILRMDKEAEGYDREAYEHEIDLQKKKAILPDLVPAAGGSSDNTITYLVELAGPLDSREHIQQIAGLDDLPPVVYGKSTEDERAVSLCCIDGMAKAAILQWASTHNAGFEPTIFVDPRSLRKA